jgi:hypothetical protein
LLPAKCLSYRRCGADERETEMRKTSTRKGMDPAMKTGLRAIGCSVLIVALTYLAMHVVPISIG